MTDKRFYVEYDGYRYFLVIDRELPNTCVARLDTMLDAKAVVEICEMYEGLR